MDILLSLLQVHFTMRHPQMPMDFVANSSIQELRQPIRNCAAGYHCRAGRSGFWINWKGELLPCGMFNEPKANLLELSFMDAWKRISPVFRNLPVCSDCETCEKRNICIMCPAACYTETGSTTGKPQYLCDTTAATVELLLQYLPEKEQAEYRNLLNHE